MRIQLIRYHDTDNINTRLAESLNKRQGVLPPLGLAYIASSLERARHTVEIVDAQALCLSKDDVAQSIREFKPHLVGVTTMTPTFRGALIATQLAKEAGAQTIIGGAQVALFPRASLSHSSIDFGTLGEAEETILELCTALEYRQPFNDIKGLAYKENDSIYINSPRIVENLNNLPQPAYHLLPMKKYSSIIGLHPVSSIIASRGCPYQCGFCYKTPSDAKYRERNPKLVVNEIEFLIKEYGIKEIMFYNDLMLPDFTEQFCNELLKRKIRIRWQSPQRVNLVTPQLLSLMKRAGCGMLRYGVEQGDAHMMQLVEKRVTLDVVKRVFAQTHEAGIETFAYFIIGYINETPKTMQATINLAKSLHPRYVMFTKAVPLPGTPLMDMAVKQGFVEQGYWRRFTLGEKVEPIPPFVPDVDMWVKKAYREFYLRPSKMIDQICKIRSWQDIKKNLSGFMGLLNFKMSKK